MAVMVTMTVVVAEHAAVVDVTTPGVDVGETIGNHAVAFHRGSLLKQRPFSLPSEAIDLKRDSSSRLLPLRHDSIVPQKGCLESRLSGVWNCSASPHFSQADCRLR
jgi:hypothetical protein